MWLSGQEVSLKQPTLKRYKEIVAHFVEFLGKAAEKDLSALSETHIEQFREAEAKHRSRGTANLSLKLVRMLLRSAVSQRGGSCQDQANEAVQQIALRRNADDSRLRER